MLQDRLDHARPAMGEFNTRVLAAELEHIEGFQAMLNGLHVEVERLLEAGKTLLLVAKQSDSNPC